MLITNQLAVVANLGMRHRQFTVCVESYEDGSNKVACGYPYVALGAMVMHSVRCLCGDVRKGSKVVQTEEYIGQWRMLIEQACNLEQAAKKMKHLTFQVVIDTANPLWQFEQEHLQSFYPEIFQALPGEVDGKITATFPGGDVEGLFAAFVLASQRGLLSVLTQPTMPTLQEDELEQVAMF